MRSLAITFTLLFTIQYSIAEEHSGATLDRVSVSETGVAILWASSGWGSAANNDCSTDTGVLAFDTNNEGGKSMLSIALAAFMAGKTVSVFTSDTDCIAVSGLAPVIKRIDVIK
ncbi:hypothetical protein [Microbulbifer spongiae]|uniref:Uncharacterized protein n=1 Tax=Microbulbifer spongiae TaxID=2944933 RepID=A0ABY9EBS7_9GAMM|nr:hypothetical protein [Microbulbifer sp. MI-G]WKD48231.1 hypothetical protein M8T91_09790 [Microbulbifer sp. MI-G]